MRASRTTRPHFSLSRATKAPSSSGLLASGSTPALVMRWITTGLASAPRSASESRAMAAGGVPAVVITAPQEVAVAWG